MLELPKQDSAKIVRQAMEFRRPDRLPVYDGFWSEFAEAWRRAYGLGPDADIEDHYWLDMRVLTAREEFFPTRVREIKRAGEDVWRDEGWGRVVRRKEGTYFSETVDRILKDPRDLDRLQFDPAGLEVRYDGFLDDVRRHHEKGQAIFLKIGGPFIRTTFLRGEVEFLMDMAEDEPLARALVEKVGEHLLQIGLESLKRSRGRDYGVWIFDDMCNANSPMFSPATFERVFLPTYKRMVATLKAAGARWVMLHCDGNVGPLLDLALEAGIEGINPVEYHAGLDVVKLLDRYAGRLRFVGGADNVHILPSGDAARIRRHIEAIVDAGRNGGVIIGTHSIGPDISIESYELYRRIVAERGAYAKGG